MATCPWCGKRGFFLRLGQHGLCKDCEIRLHNLLERIRVINESVDIASQSNNAETSFSRIEFARTQINEFREYFNCQFDPLTFIGSTTSLSDLLDNTNKSYSIVSQWIDSVFQFIQENLNEKGPSPFKDIISFFEDNPEYWDDEYDLPKSIRSLLEHRSKLYGISREKIKNKYYYYLDGQEEMLEQIQNGLAPYTVDSNAPAFQLSSSIVELLWIKNGPYQNLRDTDEPSLIDLTLPIDENISQEDLLADIGYYPSYAGISPKERYIYLKWLEDTNKPIPIGYVFIFYYGLERYLFTSKYMMAVDKIIELMIRFDNPSFRAYATDALLIVSALNKNPDIISKIPFWDNMPTSTYFYFKAQIYHEFSADDLIKKCRFWGFTNKRYIDNEPILFKKELEEILQKKYGCTSYPVDPKDLKDSKSKIYLSLANYSLSKRTASFPDLSSNSKISSDIKEILQIAHESVKVILRKQRSSQKNISKKSLPVLTTDENN